MKTTRKALIVLTTIICIMAGYFMGCVSYAAEKLPTGGNTEELKQQLIDIGIFAIPTKCTEFNTSAFLRYSTLLSSNEDAYIQELYDISKGNCIPVYTCSISSNGTISKVTTPWQDGLIDSRDPAKFASLDLMDYGDDINECSTENWIPTANDIILSLADGLKINKDRIHLLVTYTTPKIEGYTSAEQSFTIDSREVASKTGFKDDVKRKILEVRQINYNIAKKTDNWLKANTPYTQQIIEVKAVVDNGAEYNLVIGIGKGQGVNNHDTLNMYLLGTKPATPSEDPVTPPTNPAFDTTLEYDSNPKGKMDGTTYLPPYYENEDKDAKKDVDATAIIKSKTEEEIKSTNGVDLIAESNKPNTEGWYYPDVNDKTVIAKVYPFDKYNNTKDNGMVKETIKIVGTNGGTDEQSPSIKWTFRRINIDEKENSDGSVTVTITYNLPVDKDSIPEGWAPIYDEDGKTIHKIAKTIKKGENYDKDVTVKQNGTDAKVTTPVKKVWKKEPTIPAAGATSTLLVLTIAGFAVFAVTRYYKLKK